MYVRNIESPRTGRPVANQFIVETKGHSYFQSYNSLVAVVFYNELQGRYYAAIGPDWNYSRTTMKYLCKFLKEAYDWHEDWNKAKILEEIKNGEIYYCDYESELEQF